jgi:hypothetical protein
VGFGRSEHFNAKRKFEFSRFGFMANGLFQHSLGQRPRFNGRMFVFLANGHIQTVVFGLNMAVGQSDSFCSPP